LKRGKQRSEHMPAIIAWLLGAPLVVVLIIALIA
jgi:hypothetical protein